METTVSYSGVTLALSFDRRDAFWPDKTRWSYRLSDSHDGSVVLCEGSDLSVPDRDGMAGAVAAFLSFLGAWAESSEDDENAGLFPAELRDVTDWQAWADMVRLWWGHSDD